MKEDQKAAGRLVAAERGRLGLTQEALALRAGITARTLSSFESGERWPRSATRVAIEDALGLPAGALDGSARATSAARVDPSLTRASDAELLQELARRLATASETKEAGDGDELNPAPMNEGERGSSTVTDLGGERRRRDDWSFGHRGRGDLETGEGPGVDLDEVRSRQEEADATPPWVIEQMAADREPDDH